MFCQNCGQKLESQEQKFCVSCGSEISFTPDAPQLKAEENQVSPTIRSTPVYEPKTIKAGGPGLHSKRCFAFAMTSLALAVVGFAFGASSFIRILIPYSYYYYYPSYYSFGLIGLIVGVILNITGLIFGILSRKNCKKARNFEPVNTLEKVGSVFAVFGIIINSIPIVVVSIVLIIMLLSLMMMMSFYY